MSFIPEVVPAGSVWVALADAIGCSLPEDWKNVKCTLATPAVSGSTYVCTVRPPPSAIVYSVGFPAIVEICSGGSFGVTFRGMLTAPVCSCTTAAIDHVPVTDRLVPVPFQSDPERFRLRLDPPMSGLDGNVKFNTRDRTLTGAPVS